MKVLTNPIVADNALNDARNEVKEEEEVWSYQAPNLGSSVHHVSVPRSVADTHNSSKIDIKNHTFIANGETYYMVQVTLLGT